MQYLEGLNSVQYQAVTHQSGPALIIAGPGSGKTRVLTLRIAHLLKQGVKPYQILALTFTNKAAREMKKRIGQFTESNTEGLWAGTFHSVFARILRSEAPKIGYPKDFSIYDPSDVKSLLANIVKGQGLDPKVYTATNLAKTISMAKNQLISPQAYGYDADRLMSDKQRNLPYVYKIYEAYAKRCQAEGAMDFDDLLYQMHRLLAENQDGVCDKYRERFKHILVDEYQDTNPLQYSIIQLLCKYPNSPENLCVVGDDGQSIYAFRGATIDNILNFRKDYPSAAVYKLEQNYRSTRYIVQASNDVISKNTRQLKKTIFTAKQGGEPIKIVRVASEPEEAQAVADRIGDLMQRQGLNYQDFGILYRTNAQSRAFEEVFKRRRIPYRIVAGLSFYERKEVKDALAYLRVVVNPKDGEALRRIINYPARGIGDNSLEKLNLAAAAQNLALYEVLGQASQLGVSRMASNAIAQFVQMIEVFRTQLTEPAYNLAEKILRMSGLAQELNKDRSEEGQERVANVQELLDGIKSFTDEDQALDFMDFIEDRSLASYLQNVLLLTDVEQDREEDNNKVQLMSVHASKGLEFPAVFVVGMEEKLFPSAMALNDRSSGAIEEERRLFYVAITRAERFLTLSYASSRYKFGRVEFNGVSRFLDEISPEALDLSASRSGVSGMRKAAEQLRMGARPSSEPSFSPSSDFKPSPSAKVVAGAKIIHERFGRGKVIAIDGQGEGRVATILFDEAGEKRIMLRLAKIQVL